MSVLAESEVGGKRMVRLLPLTPKQKEIKMDATIHEATSVRANRESFSKDTDDVAYDFFVLSLIVETENGKNTIRIFSREKIEIEEGR